ncbi:MAG: hypothetical protein HY525_05025 [Betaproteobacteria bacterium]|nr:hypothetical protein [Betaproteobacteria bacterium]
MRLSRVFGLPEVLTLRAKIAASVSRAIRPPDMSRDNSKARTGLGGVADPLDELTPARATAGHAN